MKRTPESCPRAGRASRAHFAGALLLCLAAFGCKAEAQAPADITPASSVYKTEIFNLVDPDGNQFGSPAGHQVSAAFDGLLGQSGIDPKLLRQRLLSGPAVQGALWQVGGAHEWLYQICQAHQCNVTNVAMFYDASSHRAAGRLIYRCATQWLGHPSDAEKALIEAQYPVTIKAADAAIFCKQN
ncbi:hypothetical protein [Burkholderia sp. Ac-20379]|uniref:hypothetical protein n=1 Tax=Burkholderia sp. Ac-20379 TaxID=2703900 RepID=UPI00198079E8|nr:hypothetical protein [Burkholderia sp. Ac-20379]MBN3726170.1 hypothetical protein [Burkholderia sp. Ac-20379]